MFEQPSKLASEVNPDGKVQSYGQIEGWLEKESKKSEQEQLATNNFKTICNAVEQYQKGRWTNDPEVFPDLKLHECVPFPPHDQQYYICGLHDLESSKLKRTSIPDFRRFDKINSTWMRLTDFADFPDACCLFEQNHSQKTHLGRICQGPLDNGYFVEALQAVSLRPRLAKQLFYYSDIKKSVYVTRIHKHGEWVKLELDDYVPAGPKIQGEDNNVNPICCRSEFFPHVLWPSLIEKAYAKLHTHRESTSGKSQEDWGGWEAIGGGGHVEEALADLTGGVAGRFSTKDVSVDRLFIYIYEQQKDTLFVCRTDRNMCEMHGVHLNPYYPNVVNRAAVFEGQLYIQLFCSAPGVYDGGLQDLRVPWGLMNCKDYPERLSDGFFWITAMDFHDYCDTIIECRLTNSGDVSIKGMPSPRLPGVMPTCPSLLRTWVREWVFASKKKVTRNNPPRFSIFVPEDQVPCDIIAAVDQQDQRMEMDHPNRKSQAAFFVKVYEKIGDNFNSEPFFHDTPVCNSNWLPIRDAMVAFTVTESKEFRLIVEFPDAVTEISRIFFRCYATQEDIQVSPLTAQSTNTAHFKEKFNVTPSNNPPTAQILTLVGSSKPTMPHKFDDGDYLRTPDLDLGVTEDLKHDCSTM